MNLRRSILLVVLLAACDAPPGDRSCKPEAPITVSASLSGDPLVACEIRAEATCEAGDVEVEVVLPGGVTHLAGPRTATGRNVSLAVRARAPDRTPRTIYVRATLRDGTAKLTRVVPLPTEEATKPPQGILKRNSRGEAILELTP